MSGPGCAVTGMLSLIDSQHIHTNIVLIFGHQQSGAHRGLMPVIPDDKMHGLGVFLYADGGRYEGGWEAGERSGRGVMVYTSSEAMRGDAVRCFVSLRISILP